MPSGRKTLTITNSIIRSFYRHIHYETYFDAGQRRDTNHANVGHKPTNRSDEAWNESPTDQQSTDKHTLRITGRQAGRRQEIDKSHPGCSFSQNGQRHTDDRIQRNHTNRSQSSGKLDGSEPGEAGSGRAFADLSCFHGFQRTFRKNMGTVHTTGQITSQKPGRSGNLSSACL